jgi:hypothetical protein
VIRHFFNAFKVFLSLLGSIHETYFIATFSGSGPGSGAFVTPRSRMGNQSGIRDKLGNLDPTIEQFLGLKYLNTLMRTQNLTLDSEWQNSVPG